MTVFFDISAALDTQLNAMAGLPPVAWENFEYTPVNGTLYIRPTNLFADSVQASLGSSGQDVNTGIYQVDIFAEQGQGKNEALTMADTIATHFKRGTLLTYNSRTIRIERVRQKPGVNNNDGWYMITVEIDYISFTTPRA